MGTPGLYSSTCSARSGVPRWCFDPTVWIRPSVIPELLLNLVVAPASSFKPWEHVVTTGVLLQPRHGMTGGSADGPNRTAFEPSPTGINRPIAFRLVNGPPVSHVSEAVPGSRSSSCRHGTRHAGLRIGHGVQGAPKPRHSGSQTLARSGRCPVSRRLQRTLAHGLPQP